MSHAPTVAFPRVAPSATPKPSPQRAPAPPAGNVVHEHETQRQHVRVRVPGHIEYEHNGQRVRAKLFDVSAGGFSFQQQNGAPQPGTPLKGTLSISNEPISFTLPVSFQVRNVDGNAHRIGACFQDLGAREIGALRELISSVITGEAVTVGDVMRSPSRMAKPRASAVAPSEQRTPFERFRAMAVSIVALSIGVTAFGYALKQAHHMLFVTSANAAKVAGQVYTVAMPREGMFYSLVPSDNLVKKGAAIASFEASVLDLVRGQALAGNITAEQLAKLTTQSVKGTITSPCDCRVQVQFVANAQYAGRGQPLFELTPQKVEDPQIMARFRYDQADKVAPGTKVNFHVSGDFGQHKGVIKQLRVPNETETVGGDIIAMIQPDQPLSPEMVNRPVAVDVGGLARFDPFAIVTSMAAGRENTE
jgi:alginate biosynthesis protein Alg44